jgi:hypothetical protein
VKTEGSAAGTLHIVSSNDAPARRLTLARRHIETAIAHINDVAQSRIPMTTQTDIAPGVDELRLIVRALADIREALRSSDAKPADSTA